MDVDNRPARATRGFTLIELITTLAVVGISLAILAPGWSGVVGHSQLTSGANRLLAQLQYARNVAVTRNLPVALCPSVDATTCSGDPTGWQGGYLVFLDHDRDRQRSPDEPLLRVQDALPNGLRLHSSTGRPAVLFRGDGAAWGSNTSFRLCTTDDRVDGRAIVLHGTGRARVDKRLPGDRPVTCG